ncbi:adenylate cyclase, terminal-differentiation specific-like, partial [Centruroides vittatus]|uniref:adenylate cyclase, terminal-differentiation specific-like n=1 Tax=Centruroides vittatus TaxID=120091 RepID=UPI00350F2A8A
IRRRKYRDLSQVLRQVRDAVQYAREYSEGNLQESQQYLVGSGQTEGEYDQRVQQLIQQVKPQAGQLREQVYHYLEYSQQRYGRYSQYPGYEGYQYSGSQYYDYPEYEYYPYEGQYGYQARRVLRQIRNVLQKTQYYTERKLEKAQQSLWQYKQSEQQPSQQEQQLIQEVKSEAYSLQQQVYKYLQYPQEEATYEGSQQVARILYQVQYILQAAQYYSQRQLGRAQYILSQYEQSDYEPSQKARQLLQKVQEQASYLREQIYQGTQYFVQNSGDENYLRQQYGQYYGYQQYSHYGRQSYDYGYEANRYYESYQGQQYDSQLTRVLSQVRYVLHSAQQRSQQRLQQAQELYAEHQQPGNQVQRLAQQLRSQASYVQQQVYEYTQYDQGYGGYESTGYSGFRSQLQQLWEIVEQGVDTETIETYVRQNFPSESEVAESIREQLRHGRQQLRRYLEEAIGSGYSAYDYDPSSSDYQRVRSSFERRYGLPYSDDYYEFARYVVQTYDADLSAASTSFTVRQLAEYFLSYVSQVGEGVLQHALEFFRQYRPQVGEYYYRAVRDAVRQQMDE